MGIVIGMESLGVTLIQRVTEFFPVVLYFQIGR